MDQSAKGLSEDWLSVWIGLLVFVLALGLLGGADVLGWVVTTGVWTDVSKALSPVSKAYSSLGGVGALIATYLALLVVTAGAVALRGLKRFARLLRCSGSATSWIASSFANFAVTTPAGIPGSTAGRKAPARRLHTRARRGPGRPEFLSGFRGMDEGGAAELSDHAIVLLGGFTPASWRPRSQSWRNPSCSISVAYHQGLIWAVVFRRA
jgi:hypothetical protein